MKKYSKCNINEDAIKAITTIGKKYPAELLAHSFINQDYEHILPSNSLYSYEEKKYTFAFYKEMVKEGIIKKGECKSDIIEKMMFIEEEFENKKDLLKLEEDFLNEAKDFVKVAKEKGFEKDSKEEKHKVIIEFLFAEWKELCKEDNSLDNKKEVSIKEEEEEENIKKFCNNILSYSLDIQLDFIHKIYNIVKLVALHPENLSIFKGRKNGLFFYIFIPLFFKNHYPENILFELLDSFRADYRNFRSARSYLMLLFDEILNRLMKEYEEDMEINDEIVNETMFLWTFKREERNRNKGDKCLVDLSVKVVNYLGRIEEKPEKIEEKEKESMLDKCNHTKVTKEDINKKRIILLTFINLVNHSFTNYSYSEKLEKNYPRIAKEMLSLVKKNVSDETSLLKSGDKKKIKEYILLCCDINHFTSDIFSYSSYSFPFSNNTIIDILLNILPFSYDEELEELIRVCIPELSAEMFNDTLDMIKLVNESDIMKDIEKEECEESKEKISVMIKKRLFVTLNYFKRIVLIFIPNVDIYSFDKEYNWIIKKLINILYTHNNNYYYNSEKEEEKKDKDKEEIIQTIPFIMNVSRDQLLACSLQSFVEDSSFSFLDFYYLVRKSGDGCDIIGIFMKELTGEVVDRIKRREGINIIKERRRFERETKDAVYREIMRRLNCLFKFLEEYGRHFDYLGSIRKRNCYNGKEKEVREAKNYIKDVIEEEDVRECALPFCVDSLGEFKKNEYLGKYLFFTFYSE